MTTIGYCGTDADGRINENMMYMDESIRPQLENIIQQLKQSVNHIKISGQMVHCGHFTKNRQLQKLKRPLGPSVKFIPLGASVGMPIAGAMSINDIDNFVASYHRSAVLMKSVGFDAIEIHFGHGYGISQFISPKTNHRTDEYGGNLTNRMRLALRVLNAVRRAVGNDFPILGKIGLTDGVKGGQDENEAIEAAAMLDAAGIDALITSGGTSSYNVMKMFRGSSIHHAMIENEKNPLMRLGLKLFGSYMFQNYPYEELYFLEGAKRLRDRVKQAKIVYVGGCSNLASIDKVMTAGLDFIQMGRPLLKDPNFVNNAIEAISTNQSYDSGCIHCNRCVGLIESEHGIVCPLNV